MTGADLDHDGNLRVSFAKGAFANPEALQWAAYSAAVVINDVQADVIGSFRRSSDVPHNLVPPQKIEPDMKILIEDTEDNLEFGELVCEELLSLNPNLRDRIVPVVSLQGADLLEVKRYLAGEEVNWSLEEKRTFLSNITEIGLKANQIDLKSAFNEIRLIEINTGEVLYDIASASWFVYIPFGKGLRIYPRNSTVSYPNLPWELIGDIGLIRGSIRDTQIVAEQKVKLLMIPKEIYLKYWYHPYSIQEFTSLCSSKEIQRVLQDTNESNVA